MAASLESTLAAQALSTPRTPLADGDQVRVPLELLDANPYQPRRSMEVPALEELKASLRAEGLIQPIALRPKSDGRFLIVAGHRRVEAFRQLLVEATDEAERARWATIAGIARLAIDEAHLAAMAYMENVARAALTPIEQARAIRQMLDAGLAKTNEEVAALIAQPVRTVQRLLRLARAPRFLTDAVDSGVMVVVGQDTDGRERRELRRVELMQALQFQALFEHLQKSKPRVAEERTQGALRRALAANWSLRRTEDYVQGVLRGRPEVEGEGGAEQPSPAEAVEVAVFERTARRFVVDLSRLRGATEAQRRAVQAAFEQLLGEASSHG